MLTLYTSGSTDEPKEVSHPWSKINAFASKSIKEIGLDENDRVLDVFPSNTIAHYTITAYPAIKANSKLTSCLFNPFTYCETFKKIQPTFISLIPRHYELLKNTKGFKNLDMSSVRYMVTGSSAISQEFIDAFRSRGVTTVANWYGMTEFPPPVFIGYNSTRFDLQTIKDDHVMFHPITSTSSIGECIINGRSTGDLFDMQTMEFHSRIKEPNGKTWKNNF